MLQWGIGSSGAEGLAAAHLTSSLDNSMLNAPMPLSDPSVKPLLLSFSHLTQCARPIAPMRRVSVYPATIECTDGGAIGLTGTAESASSCPICRGDHLDHLDALIIWISEFSLCFGASTVVWTCHLDGELDFASRR